MLKISTSSKSMTANFPLPFLRLKKEWSLRLCLFALLSFCISPIFAQWEQTGGPSGMRLNYIHKAADTLWASSDSGLWYLEDSTANWQRWPHISDEASVDKILKKDDWTFYISENYLYRYHHSLGAAERIFTGTYFNGLAVQDVFFIGNRLFAHEAPYLTYSDDFGATWFEFDVPPFMVENVDDILYDEETVFIFKRPATSIPSLVYFSEDKGLTWQISNAPWPTTDFNVKGLLKDDLILVHESGSDSLNISTDLGTTWSRVYVDSMGNWGLHEFKLLSDGRIFAFSNRIYISEDNGMTWQKQEKEYPGNYASVERFQEQVYFITAFGCVQSSDDLSAPWKAKNTGLLGTNIYRLHSSPNDVLYANSINSLYRSSDSGASWEFVSSNPAITAIKELQFIGDTLITVSPSSLSVSFDLGSTWKKKTNNSGISSQVCGFAIRGTDLYAGRLDSLFRSVDLGDTWEQFSFPSLQNLEWISDLIVFDSYLFAVTNKRELFKYSFLTGMWESESAFIVQNIGNNYNFRVFDSGLFLLGDGQPIYSTDGNTWEELPINNIGTSGFNDVYHLAANNGIIYASLDGGNVYKTEDFGQNWSFYGQGFGGIRSRDLLAVDYTLFAGTFTSSIWKRDLTTSVLAASEGKKFSVFPNPASHSFQVQRTDFTFLKNANVEIWDSYGKLISMQHFSSNEIDCQSLPVGLYLICFRDEAGKLLRSEKLVIQR